MGLEPGSHGAPRFRFPGKLAGCPEPRPLTTSPRSCRPRPCGRLGLLPGCEEGGVRCWGEAGGCRDAGPCGPPSSLHGTGSSLSPRQHSSHGQHTNSKASSCKAPPAPKACVLNLGACSRWKRGSHTQWKLLLQMLRLILETAHVCVGGVSADVRKRSQVIRVIKCRRSILDGKSPRPVVGALERGRRPLPLSTAPCDSQVFSPGDLTSTDLFVFSHCWGEWSSPQHRGGHAAPRSGEPAGPRSAPRGRRGPRPAQGLPVHITCHAPSHTSLPACYPVPSLSLPVPRVPLLAPTLPHPSPLSPAPPSLLCLLMSPHYPPVLPHVFSVPPVPTCHLPHPHSCPPCPQPCANMSLHHPHPVPCLVHMCPLHDPNPVPTWPLHDPHADPRGPSMAPTPSPGVPSMAPPRPVWPPPHLRPPGWAPASSGSLCPP